MAGGKKMESWYVIDEDDDELTVVEARTAEDAVRGLFDVVCDDPNMEPFNVTVFRAKDARRFEITPNVEVSLHLEEIP